MLQMVHAWRVLPLGHPICHANVIEKLDGPMAILICHFETSPKRCGELQSAAPSHENVVLWSVLVPTASSTRKPSRRRHPNNIDMDPCY